MHDITGEDNALKYLHDTDHGACQVDLDGGRLLLGDSTAREAFTLNEEESWTNKGTKVSEWTRKAQNVVLKGTDDRSRQFVTVSSSEEMAIRTKKIPFSAKKAVILFSPRLGRTSDVGIAIRPEALHAFKIAAEQHPRFSRDLTHEWSYYSTGGIYVVVEFLEIGDGGRRTGGEGHSDQQRNDPSQEAGRDVTVKLLSERPNPPAIIWLRMNTRNNLWLDGRETSFRMWTWFDWATDGPAVVFFSDSRVALYISSTITRISLHNHVHPVCFPTRIAITTAIVCTFNYLDVKDRGRKKHKKFGEADKKAASFELLRAAHPHPSATTETYQGMRCQIGRPGAERTGEAELIAAAAEAKKAREEVVATRPERRGRGWEGGRRRQDHTTEAGGETEGLPGEQQVAQDPQEGTECEKKTTKRLMIPRRGGEARAKVKKIQQDEQAKVKKAKASPKTVAAAPVTPRTERKQASCQDTEEEDVESSEQSPSKTPQGGMGRWVGGRDVARRPGDSGMAQSQRAIRGAFGGSRRSAVDRSLSRPIVFVSLHQSRFLGIPYPDGQCDCDAESDDIQAFDKSEIRNQHVRDFILFAERCLQ
ncbi:MAG: hypothetical protein M1816_006664 [Peltula sp. TS41687]|nr:MAG: hypothetical protein M1816_006664 [Peltula sp. TS41687]